ncbi:MAG: hypothetical protein QW404_01080 [Candidatus Nanoarchaeia archaeon]
MKKLIIATIIILSSMLVLAQEISVKHAAITDKVYPGETAKFRLMITNYGMDDTFTISKDPLGYAPFSPYFKDIMINPNIITIASQDTEEAIVEVGILDNVEPGRNYKTIIKIKARTTDRKIDYPLAINVMPPENPVTVELTFPEAVMPGKEYSYKLKLKNTANMILAPVSTYVTTNFFTKDFKDKRLYAYQEMYLTEDGSEEIKFKLKPDEKPGKQTVSVTVYKGEKLIGKITKAFEVVSNPDVEEKIATESAFLVRTIRVSKTNKGNIVTTERYEFPISKLTRTLTKFDPEPIVGEEKVEWILDIPPGETRTITITTNYKPLFYGIIALILIIIMVVWKIKRSISITKHVVKVRGRKGEVLGMKILLHVKNKTGQKITDIRVIDILPSLLKTGQEFGTLKPMQIQKGEKSSRLIWNIEGLEAGEERLISYKVEPNLQVFGTILLPPALLRFKKKGKVIDKKSNRVVVYSEGRKDIEED